MDFIDWIVDLLYELKIERTDIVGNSFGGFLSLSAALHLPERVKRAVVISPAASFVIMWPTFWHQFIPTHVIAPRIGSKQMILNAYAWMWQGLPTDDCILQLRNITALNGLPHHGPPAVFTDDELRKIQTPILLLIGDHEVIYNPQKVIRRAMRLLPNLEAEIVPNANHNAQYTAPDLVNRKILDFLEN
jgi:pimeloyl-ACP methyl ester carboxylesterase